MENKVEKKHNNVINEAEEEINDDFHCCVCLELLYKPVALTCGHISCFWCVYTAMFNMRQPHCPMCRHPFYHFPSICQLLNSVLFQLYPIAYKRRERRITEQEKESEHFSPQFDDLLSASKLRKEMNNVDGVSSLDVSCIGSCSTVNETSSSIEGHLKCVGLSDKDLICVSCEKLLYRPVVLNCGHVYCEACIIGPDNVKPKCRVCGSTHPSEYLRVCLVLEQFLENQFFEQYATRKKDIIKQVGLENGRRSCSSKSQKNATKLSSQSSIPRLPEVKVHHGVGCDYCGMFPIVGERYKCLDCREKAGFDLCESCYNTPPNIQGRFNQQHKPDHSFEIVQLNAHEQDSDTESEENMGGGFTYEFMLQEGRV